MNIVIVGDGKVGFALTAQLSREGHDVVVIDNKREVLGESSERLDVLAIHGNGVSMKTQLEAGVDRADLLIAATSADEVNLLCCLVARKLGCKATIARVRNPEYEQQLVVMKEELGLSLTINPEKAAAFEIHNRLRFPSFLDMDTFAKGRVHIVQILLRPDCPYVGKMLKELYDLNKIRALICAVQRGEEIFIPDGQFALRTGDKVFVTAPSSHLRRLIYLFGVEAKRISDVMIIGGGRIAYYLAQELLNDGVGVKIIEKKADRCLELVDLLPKAIVLRGDGTDQRVLQGEGIREADAVVTLTNMDEENLIISMYANYLGVPKVVTKINRTEYNEVFQDKGIDNVVSPKELTVETLVHYVRSMSNAGPEAMLALYRLAGGMADAMEFVATAATLHLGHTLMQITLKPNILIAVILRKGSVIVPKGKDTIELGDHVFVVADSSHQISELNDIFLTGETL